MKFGTRPGRDARVVEVVLHFGQGGCARALHVDAALLRLAEIPLQLLHAIHARLDLRGGLL